MENNVKRVYLAGPFFNEAEIRNIEYAESVLKKKGLPFFSPMRQKYEEEINTTKWARRVFEDDKEAILKSDIVVALYYGSNGDTGTAWECGFSFANSIPVVLVHVNPEGDSNLMMHCSCATNIYLKDLEDFDFNSMPAYDYKGKMY